MSIPLVINGATFEYPINFDENWGTQATGWAQAVTNGMLQRQGGNFPLLSDTNFGPTFGLISPYYKSTSTNIAAAGVIRLSKIDTINWRNNANSADNILAVDGSNNLTFNGVTVGTNGTVNSGTANQLAYYATSSSTVSGTNAFTVGSSGPNGIVTGTNTNDSAASGKVGEYISSTVSLSNTAPSGTFQNITSISLPAGDWDVTGTVVFTRNSATFTSSLMQLGISTTSNASSGYTDAYDLVFTDTPLSFLFCPIHIPSIRLSLSTTTTIYLIEYVSTFTGTPQHEAFIGARRVR